MGEIVADPGITTRAQRLDPRRLDRVIDRARHRLDRRGLGVERGVVQLQPQRKGVGEPARLGHLFGGQRTAGHRHADMLARGGRRVGGEGELDLRLLRDGTRRAAEDRLEPVERGFVRQEDQARPTTLSGRSLPKTR